MKSMTNTKLILAALLVFAIGLSSFTGTKKAESKVNWLTFEEAIAANKDNPKKIFIDIYTDWCGWCKKMDAQTFNHPDIATYMNENFHNVKFDAEQSEEVVFNGHTFKFIPGGRKGVHELAVALTNNNLSYPMGVFMDEEFRILSPLPGYQKAPFFDAVLRYFGEENYKSMKWDEFMKGYDSPLGD